MKWEIAKLGKIAIIRTGKLDSNAAVIGGRYPFFTCDPNTLSIDVWAYDTEAVLLAGNNASGNYTAKYYKGKFNAYQRTYIIESANEEELNIRYLCYALNQQLRLLKTMSSGSTTKFLTVRMLDNLDIPLFGINIQTQIVNILSAYDDLIENNQKQIKLLEEAAQRLYKEWFVDLRFPGHENTKIVDGVPEGWSIYPFSSKVDIMSEGTPKTSIPDYYNGKIPFYTPKDNDGAFFAYKTQMNITEGGLKNCNSRLYPPKTVIITARGTVGKTTILAVPMAMNQSCYALKMKENDAPYYLFFALNNEIKALQTMANGGVFNTIIGKTFDSINIQIPKDPLIYGFEETVRPFMKQIKNKLQANLKLVEARDRLLPKLMNGEVEA
jgi:type I restriction enzyme ecoDI specificity protein